MNTIATLLVLAALNGHAPPGQSPTAHLQEREQQPGILLAQASTPPPGPMNPAPPGSGTATPSTAPSIGAPAPTPKIDELPDGPPLGSLSLSQLILKVEGEPEFAYVRDIDWREGKYRVTYVTRNGEAHEKAIDPRTGRETGRATQTGGQNGGSPGSTPDSGGASGPAYNPTGTPSSAPSTDPRPGGQTR